MVTVAKGLQYLFCLEGKADALKLIAGFLKWFK